MKKWKDGAVILAMPIIIGILASMFKKNSFWEMFYILIVVITTLLMITLYALTFKKKTANVDMLYYMLTVMYDFEGINIMTGVMLRMGNYGTVEDYLCIYFECALMELICIHWGARYSRGFLKINEFIKVIGGSFLGVILISRLLYHLLDFKVYHIVCIIVMLMVALTNLMGMYYIRKVRPKRLEEEVRFVDRYYFFKMLCYIFAVVSTLGLKGKAQSIMECVAVYMCLIAIYFLYRAIDFNYIKKPWNKLIEDLKVTEEKIFNNSQGRNAIVNLSHELKTPLNVIQSAVQILKLDIKDKVAVGDLRRIRNSCHMAMKIIVNMIDLNKLYGGYLRKSIITCNMVEITENLVDAFVSEYKDANIIFNTNEEEINIKIDYEMFQRSCVYIMASMLNLGVNDMYMDLFFDKQQQIITISLEAKGVTSFINNHRKDILSCNEEEIGDVLAIEFIRRVLDGYHGNINYRGEDCISLSFDHIKERNEEPIYLEENVLHLREQIRSNYYQG